MSDLEYTNHTSPRIPLVRPKAIIDKEERNLVILMFAIAISGIIASIVMPFII